MATKKTTKAVTNPKEIAVIMTGGKQYKVSQGSVLKIEKIIGDHKEGSKLVFDEVLMTDDGTKTVVGTPKVAGAKVEGVIKEIGRNAKVIGHSLQTKEPLLQESRSSDSRFSK